MTTVNNEKGPAYAKLECIKMKKQTIVKPMMTRECEFIHDTKVEKTEERAKSRKKQRHASKSSLLNPGGSDTAYYAKPTGFNSCEYEEIHQKHYRVSSQHRDSFVSNSLFSKTPLG